MNDENKLSLVEVTEVVASVKRLTELSRRMHAESFGFKEEDIAHIDGIIDALHELDLHKTKTKDVLETETIKCAAVRHRLMHYPDEINRDIHEAVQFAKNVNEEAISRIKLQLGQLSDNTDQLERQTDIVDAEIASIRPTLEAKKSEFDANFAKLNALLGEKSAKQIRLNEDRDSVRAANVRIVELEEDTVLLMERMVVEREEHRDTMQRLHDDTVVTTQRLRDQTDKENAKRREFLAINAQLEQSTGELEEAVQLNQCVEHENVILQVQEQDTRRQQTQQLKVKEQLKSNIDGLTLQKKSMAEAHQTQVLQMKQTAEELSAKSQQQAVLLDKFAAQKTEIKVRTETLQVKEETVKKVQDVSQAAQRAKQDLTAKAEDLVRMRQEIMDMEGRRAELEDAERAEHEGWMNPAELLETNTVLTFNRQIADLKEQLAHERRKRMTVQANHVKLQGTANEFHAAENAQTKKINAEIDALKHEKIALDEEQNNLLAKIKADEARRAALEQRLEVERQQLDESRDGRQGVIEYLLRDTELLRCEKSEKAGELADLLPKVSEFKNFFERSTAEYDALKRSIVALKNRKAVLEESSRRADGDIGRLTTEIAELRRDKERRVAQSSRQMDDMAADRVQVEKDIYVLGCKLKTVLQENAKLEAGINRLEREMRSMRDTWELAVPAKARIDQQRAQEVQRLKTGRQRDTAMQAEFQENDKRLLAVLSVIVEDTDARKAILEAVTNGLVTEVGILDTFLRTSESND